MIMTQEQLRQIVVAGGGLTLDATTLTFDQLRSLGAAAHLGKTSITLTRVAGLTAGQLAELAALAPGLMTFDLTG